MDGRIEELSTVVYWGLGICVTGFFFLFNWVRNIQIKVGEKVSFKKLENEIFSILPLSRRKNEYCRTLKNISAVYVCQSFKTKHHYKDFIEEAHRDIVTYIGHQDKFDPIVLNKQKNHPLGDKCGFNHNTARYSWLNFVPAMFNTRGNEVYTIEFRPFNGSTNYSKIRNWTLLCMALVYVAENCKNYLMTTKVTCMYIFMHIFYLLIY